MSREDWKRTRVVYFCVKNMKIYAICFTPGGEETLNKICKNRIASEAELSAYAMGSYPKKIVTWPGRLSEWMAETVKDADAYVFVGAAGIAVRAIAPYVVDKRIDPALVVVDEKGQFVIPILSGHIGGANALAKQIAECLGAQPVLTTATDVNGLFAVDVFATENGLHISDMKQAKMISAALVAGEKVGFVSDIPWEGALPAELVDVCGQAGDLNQADVGKGIRVSVYAKSAGEERNAAAAFAEELWLIPQDIIVGVGCRKDTPKEKILDAIDRVFSEEAISKHAIAGLASIDLKKDEPGLIAAAAELGVPFETFSAEALAAVEGDFSTSSFVQGITGVDNVCERAAVLASGGKLVVRKTAADGVTVAVAMSEKILQF